MSTVPCASCADREIQIGILIRKAERARDRGTSTAKFLGQIGKLRRDLADCDHRGMQSANESTRRRHAANRERVVASRDATCCAYSRLDHADGLCQRREP